MVLVAAFMSEHRKGFSFDGKGGFRSPPSSSWVPFSQKEFNETAAGAIYVEWDPFCAVK